MPGRTILATTQKTPNYFPICSSTDTEYFSIGDTDRFTDTFSWPGGKCCGSHLPGSFILQMKSLFYAPILWNTLTDLLEGPQNLVV